MPLVCFLSIAFVNTLSINVLEVSQILVGSVVAIIHISLHVVARIFIKVGLFYKFNVHYVIFVTIFVKWYMLPRTGNAFNWSIVI